MDRLIKMLETAVAEGSDILREIKPQWSSLGFPGSVYSPNEFMLCLLLAYLGRDYSGVEALKEKIEAGKSARRNLIDSQVLRSYMGSDELGIIFVTALVSALDDLSGQPHREARYEPRHESSELASAILDSPLVQPQPVEACPHCGHDFVKCEQGDYRAMLGRRPFAAKEEAPEEIKPAAAESGVHEFCIHVDDKGQCCACTDEQVYECANDGCGEEFIEARGHKCKGEDCNNIYCDDCKKELNDAGFCGECEAFDCDNCNEEDVATEKMIRCANPDCRKNQDLCPDCGPKLLNEAGLCPDCSDEEEFTCTECECGVTDSRTFACKNKDCGAVYCVDHKDELNDAGYCPDCQEETCADCGKEFPREKGIKCSGSVCGSSEVLCHDCAEARFNLKGLCAECSGEEELTCSDCGGTVIESQAKKCRGRECENVYCPSCAGDNLDSRGKCNECQ